MVQDTKKAPAASAEAGGGVNTGVAVVGFFLCFLAGVALMWGYDQHRLHSGEMSADTQAATGGAWAESDSPFPASSKDRLWAKREAPAPFVVYSDFHGPFCSLL